MEIREINDKEIWENFLLGCQEKTFLQSWDWGEFQEMMGNKIKRLGFFQGRRGDDELSAIALVSLIRAKRGRFFLLQHGPVVKKSELREEVLRTLTEELKKIKNQEGVSFIRMNPLWLRTEENKNLFKKLGFRESPMHAYAYESAWKLDITPSEEKLLKNMRKTTRYLIRQGLNNSELTVTKSSNPEDIETYDKLNKEVARHQRFVPFSFQYLKNELEVFLKDNQALLFFGKYRDEIIASAIVIFWSNIGFYHHAALLPKYHKIPISYLLLWEAIREAKKRGCVLYDFWGYVDPQKQPKHPWAGPTLFKMGFGGRTYEYIKTQDFPLSKKYWLTYLFEKIRKIKRGL